MILETLIRQKRFFDEKSKVDIAVARRFFEEHRWGNDGCPFILEYPYITIPDMIKDKLIHKALGIEYDRRHHWSSHE
jgi:hypothetical protein